MNEIPKQYKLGYQGGCIDIAKFHRDTWDAIEYAIKDIEELLMKER